MKKKFIFIAVLFAFISCNTNQPQNPITQLSDNNTDASCVFLTKDASGNPAVSWAETDNADTKHFYLAKWDQSSGGFGPKMNIPIPQNAKLHAEGMPKIAFKGDGTIIATFETSVPVEGARFGKGDIRFSLSADGGKTWTKPASVQSGHPDGGSIGFSNVLRLEDGEIGIAWLGTGPKTVEGRPVMFARTRKGGGFTKAITIDSVACQCCRIALSSNGHNGVKIAFRNLLPGSVRDISIAESSNNGETFSSATSFSGDNWVIDGCPHDGPALASTRQKSFAAWYAGSSSKDGVGVYYAVLDKENKMLVKRKISATGKFIQLCLMPDGTRIMGYNESYKSGDSTFNRIMIARADGTLFFSKEVSQAMSHGFYPVVTPAGKNHVIIAWKDGGKILYRTVSVADINVKMPDLPRQYTGSMLSGLISAVNKK